MVPLVDTRYFVVLFFLLFSRTMLGGGLCHFFGTVCFANPLGFKAASIQCDLFFTNMSFYKICFAQF